MYKKYDYIVASGGLKVPLPDLSLYTEKYYEANKNPRVYHDPDYEEHLYETGLQGATLTQSIMRLTSSYHNSRVFLTLEPGLASSGIQ